MAVLCCVCILLTSRMEAFPLSGLSDNQEVMCTSGPVPTRPAEVYATNPPIVSTPYKLDKTTDEDGEIKISPISKCTTTIKAPKNKYTKPSTLHHIAVKVWNLTEAVHGNVSQTPPNDTSDLEQASSPTQPSDTNLGTSIQNLQSNNLPQTPTRNNLQTTPSRPTALTAMEHVAIKTNRTSLINFVNSGKLSKNTGKMVRRMAVSTTDLIWVDIIESHDKVDEDKISDIEPITYTTPTMASLFGDNNICVWLEDTKSSIPIYDMLDAEEDDDDDDDETTTQLITEGFMYPVSTKSIMGTEKTIDENNDTSDEDD